MRFILLAAIAFVAAGCGGGTMNNPDCGVASVAVTPATATADHAAAPPGNQVVFQGKLVQKLNPGCPAITAPQTGFNWATSDPTDVTLIPDQPVIGAATAVCKNATPGAVAITATTPNSPTPSPSGTAMLTCQ